MPGSKYQTLEDVDPLPTEYVLAGLPKIPRGDVTLVFGDGAVGKGRLIMSWIAEVVNGDDEAVCLICLPEDHPHEQIAPRLIAAGVSDRSRVVNITRLPNGARFKLSADTTHDGDIGLLREIVEDINTPKKNQPRRRVRMIVLDPIAAIVGFGSIQTNAGARRLLEPIQDLCQDTGIAGIAVAHTVTGGKLQGSYGLSQAARLVYKVSKDRANPTVRVISVDKANNLPPTEDLKFIIEDDGQGGVKVVMLDRETIDARQRAWRQPSYSAAVSVARTPLLEPGRPGYVAPVIRPLGLHLSLEDAQLACSADQDAPGPALTGWQRLEARPGTVATSVSRNDGTLVSYAISRKGA